MIKILSAEQIRQWDAWTIKKEPVSSVDLMERASLTFTKWFVENCPDEDRPVTIFCGPGNNGGDGLVVARLLMQRFYQVQVYCCKIGKESSSDFTVNLKRLQSVKGNSIAYIEVGSPFPVIPASAYVIDAIFGTGLNRPITGYWATLIHHINQSGTAIISIDLPSGLFADQATTGTCIQAHKSFSFELPRLAFFFPENHQRVGEWHYDTIGLLPDFLAKAETKYFYLSEKYVRSLIQSRSKFSHKGTYGHALLLAGSKGMAGAAILAAKACLRSGAGLLTIHVPDDLADLLQLSVPEAILSSDSNKQYISEYPLERRWDSIGIGPGLGKADVTVNFLATFLAQTEQPIVLDADALNGIAEHSDLLDQIPKGSILTPHPKEFERLFGKTKNDFERNEMQRNYSVQLGVFIVLKGAHTAITSPEGNCYFNATGNPGMATGGSGDVLTGLITGLLAQGYPPKAAALFGVWLHGLAGDTAAAKISEPALLASDIVENIGLAYLKLSVAS